MVARQIDPSIKLTKAQAQRIVDEVRLGRVRGLTFEAFDAAVTRLFGDDAPYDASKLIYIPESAFTSFDVPEQTAS